MDISTIAEVVVQGIMLGAIYGVIGLGITMVFSTTGLLNFAHGDFMAIAMYICLAIFNLFGLDPYLSMFVNIPALFALGVLVYFFLFRRVLKAEILMVIQLTLGMMFIIESALLLGFTADFQSVPNFLTATRLKVGPLTIRATHLAIFVVGGGIGGILYWMLQYSDLGRQVRAIAQNKDAAALMGINASRVQMIVFALGIALLGLAGSMTTSIITMEPYMGLGITLFAFIVMVMGGVGNFLGTLVAGYFLGVAEAMGQMMIGGHLGALVPYGLFVLILLVRPKGILGAR
jgi:branched-chain amino acid transport system permease protein